MGPDAWIVELDLKIKVEVVLSQIDTFLLAISSILTPLSQGLELFTTNFDKRTWTTK